MTVRYESFRCLPLAIALTLAAGACGRAEPPANNVSSANGSVAANAALGDGRGPPTKRRSLKRPAASADREGARRIVDAIYRPYTRGETSRARPPFTPELQAAIARQSDDLTGLGFDPFCQCQDFDNFSYTIESVEPDEEGLQAQVEIRNFSEAATVTLVLRRRGATWLVHDIIGNNGGLLAGR